MIEGQKEKKILLRVDSLAKYFPVKTGIFNKNKNGFIKAVDNISMEIYKGETMGLVGESGCGKTTTGRTILQLYKPTSGKIFLEDIDLSTLTGNELRSMRRRIQMIFQDPYASLNPRMTIGNIISEPLEVFNVVKGKEKDRRVEELLEQVGMNPSYKNRFPHEFSGGQRQRIGIARALSINPEFIVCDEPIASLDVSIQAQIVTLLKDLQVKYNLTYLFISHDLSMVKHISDHVAVMYLGKIVEITKSDLLYKNPLHPYTKALLSAIPIPDPEVEGKRVFTPLSGEIPNPGNPPKGCNFNTRCIYAKEICELNEPDLIEIDSDHLVACHFVKPTYR